MKWFDDGELRIRVSLNAPTRRGPNKRPPTHIPESVVPGSCLWTISEDSVQKILNAVETEENVTLTSPEWIIEGETFQLKLIAGFTDSDVYLHFEGAGRSAANASLTIVGGKGTRTISNSTVIGTERRFLLPIEFCSDTFKEWLDDHGQLRIRLSVPTAGNVVQEVIRESISAPGYVGLNNQGATCYMNAMLQSLFHLPAFRALVYEMPTTGSEDLATSIPLNLQRLFCRMQLGTKPCSTRPLTRSFGWDESQSIIQHDTQEFCRVLMDNLENEMRNARLEGRVATLFCGKFRSYIR
jgi:hypothetical protein